MARRNSGDSLHPPDPAEMPVCVMDGTDVETVVVTSEWTEIELHTREDNSEDDNDSLPTADCHQREQRPNENSEESEIQTEKHTDAENSSGGSELTHNKHGGALGCTEHRTTEAEQLEHNAKERLSLSCSVTPPLESTLAVPVTAADGAAVCTIPAGTRRSARKPKKTWKLKLVNLQKQKRKPGLVTARKRERKPLAPMRNAEAVTVAGDGERVTSGNRSVHGYC